MAHVLIAFGTGQEPACCLLAPTATMSAGSGLRRSWRGLPEQLVDERVNKPVRESLLRPVALENREVVDRRMVE
jgi:hypothetical protein